MKRLHIHVSVDDLNKSIIFYSALFGCDPTKRKNDYAKWMLDDPKVNFAISARGAKAGIDHLGIQVEEASELHELRHRLNFFDMRIFAEGETVCCYAKSDKTWVEGPSGIAWEVYQYMGEAEHFNDVTPRENICCTPKASEAEKGVCC